MKAQLNLIIFFINFYYIINIPDGINENFIIGKFIIRESNSSETIIEGKYDEGNLEIFINDEKLNQKSYNSYRHLFENIGEYTVIYKFNKLITDMNRMFLNCSSLISLDLSNFDSSKVTNMDMTFGECKSLKSINFLNFDSSKVTYMGGLFKNCESLISIDLSSFNTSSLTDTKICFIVVKH